MLSDPSLFTARQLCSGLFHGDLAVLRTALGYNLAVLAGAILVCWVLQTLTRNYSWVDRLWSVMPAIYLAVFAVWSDNNKRLWLMTALATLWGARLTYNFWRKGGYDSKSEDYRWAFVRSWLEKHDRLHPLGRELFSLLFIAIYQHLLIALLVIPAGFVVSLSDPNAIQGWDFLVAGAFIGFLALEAVTDEQQWAFQSKKHRLTVEERIQAGGDLARGFLTQGMFRYSRHMNFFAEMSMWWVMAAFPWLAAASIGDPIPAWTWTGPFLLTLLFQGSTQLTEALSVAHYPEYAQYRRSTSRLIPVPR